MAPNLSSNFERKKGRSKVARTIVDNDPRCSILPKWKLVKANSFSIATYSFAVNILRCPPLWTYNREGSIKVSNFLPLFAAVLSDSVFWWLSFWFHFRFRGPFLECMQSSCDSKGKSFARTPTTTTIVCWWWSLVQHFGFHWLLSWYRYLFGSIRLASNFGLICPSHWLPTTDFD